MGFLKKAKATYQALLDQQAALAGPEPIPELVAPLPQEEVDRLLAGDGPVIRAIVLGKRHSILQDGEHVARMRVDVRLRPRGAAGTLGDEATLKASVSSWVATLIEPGLDIPVERDPATGALTRVASRQLTDELSARRAEADRIRPAWGVDPTLQGMAETAEWVRDKLTGKPDPPEAGRR